MNQEAVAFTSNVLRHRLPHVSQANKAEEFVFHRDYNLKREFFSARIQLSQIIADTRWLLLRKE